MNAEEFKKWLADHVDGFLKYYVDGHKNDPESWPEVLGQGEWVLQLESYLDSLPSKEYFRE